jgi:hypothetical protein
MDNTGQDAFILLFFLNFHIFGFIINRQLSGNGSLLSTFVDFSTESLNTRIKIFIFSFHRSGNWILEVCQALPKVTQ